MNINSVADKLVSRCLSSIPEDEVPSDDVKADTSAIAHTVEGIQDRWQIDYANLWLFVMKYLRKS